MPTGFEGHHGSLGRGQHAARGPSLNLILLSRGRFELLNSVTFDKLAEFPAAGDQYSRHVQTKIIMIFVGEVKGVCENVKLKLKTCSLCFSNWLCLFVLATYYFFQF